jgi:hypothetical protein
MRWNSFSRSLLFALLAAGAVVPWFVLARLPLGDGRAIGLYLVAVTAAYLGGLAPERTRRIGVFVVAALAGCVLAIVTRNLTEQVLGLAVLLATVRSAFLYRAAGARAVAIEAVLIGTGLLFARFLSGPSIVAVMLSVWGFFLVQSLYFLIGGVRARPADGRHPDPFEDARARVLAILETPPARS